MNEKIISIEKNQTWKVDDSPKKKEGNGFKMGL